jgi:hypothetical protein
MKSIKLLAAIILALMLSNCNKDGEPLKESSFILNDTLDLAINKSAINTENQLAITIDSVLSDSRCPQDVVCVWEGNAAVRFLFTNNGKESKFVLNTHGGENYTRETIIDGYFIQLVGLHPYPVSTKEISNDEYIAELVIKKE